MLSISRRGFLAAGGTGAAGLALAACGKTADQRDDAPQEDLTSAQLQAELALSTAYKTAATAAGKGSEQTALEAFAKAASARADELRSSAAAATGGQAQAPDGGPDSAEALGGAAHAANAAIAAHRRAAGLLTDSAGRATASSYLVACAAELAAVNDFAGKPEVPSPFVTGGSEAPYESVITTSTTTSTTNTGSTTSTTSTGG